MYSKAIQFTLSIAVLFVLIGCQKPLTRNRSIEGMALLQDSQGRSYEVDCLRNSSPSSMSACEVSESKLQASQGRGFSGSDVFQAYFYYNLLGFNESDMCRYLWGMPSCYYLFGYNNYKPKNNFTPCAYYYLYPNYYGQMPAYCYWYYYQQPQYPYPSPTPTPYPIPTPGQTINKLRMRIAPLATMSSVTTQKYIQLDNYGRVTKLNCPYPSNGGLCSQQIVAYVNSTEMAQINSLIETAKTGTTVQQNPNGTIQCFAASTETRHYSANNSAVFLKQTDYPCPSASNTYYNNSSATEALVQKLNSWSNLGY